MPLVFVYGTLKRGQCNAHVMQGATFIAPAVTVQMWKLYALAAYPAMVHAPGVSPVVGEVWEVPAQMMSMLDRFEEVPTLYTRHLIEIDYTEPQGAPPQLRRVQAHAYFMLQAMAAAAGREVASGNWTV